MKNFKYVPNRHCYLLILRQAMEQEFELGGNKEKMVISKEHVRYDFDRNISSGNGTLWSTRIDGYSTEDEEGKKMHTTE